MTYFAGSSAAVGFQCEVGPGELQMLNVRIYGIMLMRIHRAVLNLALLSLVSLLPVTFAASQAHLPNRGQRVFVVGVRDTRGLHCRGKCYQMYPDDRPILDRFAPDPALQSAAMKEFRKEGRYVVASSVANADFVFIIEGDYAPVVAKQSKPPGAFTGSVGLLDQKPDHLFGVAAIAVPASIYRKAPDDWQALFRARLWSSCNNTVIVTPNRIRAEKKPEDLVSLFPDKGKQPPWFSPTLCVDLTLAQAGQETESRSGSSNAAMSAVAQSALKDSAGIPSIQVDVDFVSVPVAASDVDGKYIPDLKKSDFRIFEDDVEQEIDRLVPVNEPLNVVLMIDSSLSMPLKIDQVRQSAMSFVESMRFEDRLMVVSFDDKVHLDSEFTSDRVGLRRAILAARLGETTRLYDALDLVLTERLNPIGGRKAIVLFTDGVDTSSWLNDAAGTLAELEESNVILYAVQLETKNDETVQYQRGWVPEVTSADRAKNEQLHANGSQYLQDLASRSGGRSFRAATMDSAVETFVQVADELRHQYVLGYYPSNRARDGSYRRIRVTVNRPGVRIRARSGYRAGTRPSGK